jgi:hypothetical protein
MNVRTVSTKRAVEEEVEWMEISIMEVTEHLTLFETLIIK